jgi:phosphatidylinositol-3-phosphatase
VPHRAALEHDPARPRPGLGHRRSGGAARLRRSARQARLPGHPGEQELDETFGSDSPAPYLAQTLPSKGQLLTHYYAIGHESLDNYIALVSGQSPNPDTQSDCQFFTDFVLTDPAQPIYPGPEPPAAGQAWGRGCVYPQFITTIADQLQAQALTWKGYMEDMGNDSKRDNGRRCAHPPINSRDNTQQAEKGDQYATRHNPFVYFHSVLESRYCDKRDVPLSQLPTDLKQAGTTPKYSFIVPNLCHDGHDHPGVTGEPGGLVSANAWLKKWIPKILGSPAFKRDGLLIVTFDEAEDTGPEADSSACCDEPTGPNTADNGGPTPGPGGGRVGAVVLSPFVKPGTVNDHPVQPLLAAAQRGGHFRPALPRLRPHARSRPVRLRRLQPLTPPPCLRPPTTSPRRTATPASPAASSSSAAATPPAWPGWRRFQPRR